MQQLALGIYDNPLKQEQLILNIDLLKNNIVVFGGHMAGKTTFLKTLLVRMHESNEDGIEEETYILDLGDNLGAYSKLYNVCACFNSSNEENIKRIFKVITEKMNFNSKELSKHNQNFITYCKENQNKSLHHITFIIDNANAFFSEESYLTYQEMLLKFCRDGLSKGITVVLTANDTNIPNKFLSNFGQKIAFDVPNDKYIEIFGTRVSQPMRFKGRGLVTVNSNVLEFQCFLPFEDENTQLEKFVNSTNPTNKKNPNLLSAFDSDLTLDNLTQYTPEDIPKNIVILGLEYYQHTPVSINFKDEHTVAIYGKKGFGKTNLLNLLVKHIVTNQKEIFSFANDQDMCKFVLFDDGRKQLSHIKDMLNKNGFLEDNLEYITKISDFESYIDNNHIILHRENHLDIDQNGMIRRDKNKREIIKPIQEVPNTIFILQNRMFYQNRPLINALANMVSQASDYNYIFIYSDIPLIPDTEIANIFNSTISNAFLLDNISEFINTKGQKTIFNSMDAKELKEEYAKCELGDGYYYNFDSDVLQKLKFIKLDNETLLG